MADAHALDSVAAASSALIRKGGQVAGDGPHPSKTVAEMLSCTIARATPHLFVPSPAPGVHNRYRGLAHRRSPSRASAAGLHRRPWHDRLRRALAEEEFVLHYQPIVRLTDGQVSHYEALVRLADEGDGALVAPACFLPAAERYGLIREIDMMVLDQVARVLGGEHDLHGAGIAMNLSALSVTDPGMLAHIERRLALHGVDPSRLVIEVTETASISDIERAKAFCEGVQALGAAIALDDFGAGFGSFHYLKRLPFRFLKIDGDFIRGLPDSANDQLVVKALVAVVSGMGRETVAEFVGDEATMRLLRAYGVDYAQGFVLGRPQPLVPLAA